MSQAISRGWGRIKATFGEGSCVAACRSEPRKAFKKYVQDYAKKHGVTEVVRFGAQVKDIHEVSQDGGSSELSKKI